MQAVVLELSSPGSFNPRKVGSSTEWPRRDGQAAFPAFPITETLASSEQELIWQAKMMPIHIQPASVAQGKYFPKLTLNRRIIFEQLRGETERVVRWRGAEGKMLIFYVYMQYIFIK